MFKQAYSRVNLLFYCCQGEKIPFMGNKFPVIVRVEIASAGSTGTGYTLIMNYAVIINLLQLHIICYIRDH